MMMETKRNLRCLIQLGFGILLLGLISCHNELQILMPPGPEGPAGKSAYEVWVDEVNEGNIDWPKDEIDENDFFRYLKGKDGDAGKSAYETWIEEVEKGLENPHNPGTDWPKDMTELYHFWQYLAGTDGKDGQDGQNGQNGQDGKNAYELWKEDVLKGLPNPKDSGNDWPKDKTDLEHFWEYLRGRDGKDGVCDCVSPKMNYIQPMSKATVATTLPDDDPANWIEKNSFDPYEGYLFEPADAVDNKDPDLVTKITIPFWRQRIEFSLSCELSDMEAVLAGKDDLTGSWIDLDKSKLDHQVTESNGVFTHVFRISFEANDLPGEQFRELRLRFRKIASPNLYKDINIRQIYRPNVLGRYSNWFVGELNTPAQELTEANISSLSTDQRGYYYQFGRNIPLKPGTTYSNASAITWGSNESSLWDSSKIITGNPMYVADESQMDTWVSKVQKARQAGASAPYEGSNGGDPCPPGWHLPIKPEHYAMFIGTKGSGSHDLYRFSTSTTNNVDEGRVGGWLPSRDLSGVQWDYWQKNYSRASYKSTGSHVAGTDKDAIFNEFKPIYAVKFMSQGNNDVYENALKGAFKYEMLANGGFYYVKVTSRYLGEYSSITTANDIVDDSFWSESGVKYTTALLPLYGTVGNNGTVSLLNDRAYYWTGDIRRISTTTPGSVVLMIGGPGTTYSSPVDRYRTISAEWSFGSAGAYMLRCIKNAPDPEIPAAATTLPDWNN